MCSPAKNHRPFFALTRAHHARTRRRLVPHSLVFPSYPSSSQSASTAGLSNLAFFSSLLLKQQETRAGNTNSCIKKRRKNGYHRGHSTLLQRRQGAGCSRAHLRPVSRLFDVPPSSSLPPPAPRKSRSRDGSSRPDAPHGHDTPSAPYFDQCLLPPPNRDLSCPRLAIFFFLVFFL